jgi:hypothetical protein
MKDVIVGGVSMFVGVDDDDDSIIIQKNDIVAMNTIRK